MSSAEQGFPDYVAETNESGVALYAFVIVYTFLSLLLVGPLVIWGRRNEKNRQSLLDDVFFRGDVQHTVGLGQQPPRQDPPLLQEQHDTEVNHAVIRLMAEQLKQNEMQGDPDLASYSYPTSSGSIFREGPTQITSDMQQKRNRVQNGGGIFSRAG